MLLVVVALVVTGPWLLESAALGWATVPPWPATGWPRAAVSTVQNETAVVFVAAGRESGASSRALLALASLRVLGGWAGTILLFTDDTECFAPFLEAEAAALTGGRILGTAVILVPIPESKLDAKAWKMLAQPIAFELGFERTVYIDADAVATSSIEPLLAASAARPCADAGLCATVQPGSLGSEPFHTGLVVTQWQGGAAGAAPSALRGGGRHHRVPAPLLVRATSKQAAAARLDALAAGRGDEPRGSSPWVCLRRWHEVSMGGGVDRDQVALGAAILDGFCHVAELPELASTAPYGTRVPLVWFPDLTAHAWAWPTRRQALLPAPLALPVFTHFTSYRLGILPRATQRAAAIMLGLPFAPARPDSVCIGRGREEVRWLPKAGWPSARLPLEWRSSWEDRALAIPGWAKAPVLIGRTLEDWISWRQQARDYLSAVATRGAPGVSPSKGSSLRPLPPRRAGA